MKKNVTFDCRDFAENSYQSYYFDRSICKDKSLEEECKFCCVSWLVLEAYSCDFTIFTSQVSVRTSLSLFMRQSA